MVQPSSRPHFSFAIITSHGNQITPAKHEDNLEMKVKNPDESQEDRAVIRVVQSENILLRFLRRAHADDGCSCNHRAVPPSAKVGSENICLTIRVGWTLTSKKGNQRTRPFLRGRSCRNYTQRQLGNEYDIFDSMPVANTICALFNWQFFKIIFLWSEQKLYLIPVVKYIFLLHSIKLLVLGFLLIYGINQDPILR